MSMEVLRGIGEQIKQVRLELQDAKIVVEAMKEVGLDTTDQDLRIKNLEKTSAKWESMLKRRGISVE